MIINEITHNLSDEGFIKCEKSNTESWTCTDYIGNERYEVSINLNYESGKLIYGMNYSIPVDWIIDINFDRVNYNLLIHLDYIDSLGLHRTGVIKIPSIIYDIL